MPSEAELTAQLAKQVADDAANQPEYKLDPKYAALSADIRAKLEAARGKIADLDPETQAALQGQLANNEALLNRDYEVQKDSMLTRLFGAGRETSTLAGETGQRLMGDRALALGNLRVGHEGNVLNTRLGVTAQNLQNLGMQGDSINSERGAALDDNRLRADQFQSGANRRAGLLSGAYDRRSSERNAATAAAASRYGSDRAYDSTVYSSDASLEAARGHDAASRYGSLMANDASRYSTDGSVRAAGMGAAASRYGALMGYEASRYGTDSRERISDADRFQQGDQFDRNLLNDQYQFYTEDGRTRDFFDRDLNYRERDSQRSADAAARAARQQSRNSLLGGIGGLMGGLGAMGVMFSDERLKDNIEEIDNALHRVSQLDGVGWVWKKDGTPGGGVIAQQVRAVLPDAVITQGDGTLAVNYHAIIGLLVAAINELQGRQA